MSDVRKFLGELEKLEQFAEALEGVQERRHQRRKDDALGVLELEEVSPGVYAQPKARPRRRVLREARELLEDLEHVQKAVRK